jgi:imidazole glycerol-phosphate synthase subunit HisF
MFIPRLIPVLLLKGKGLVKTVQFDKHRYIGDPINAVRIFNDLQADELVFLDILASKEKRSIDLATVKQISDEAFMPFGVGGGINDVKSAVELISAGTEKIIINTAFTEKSNFVSELSAELGNQSVVVCIDVKRNWLGKYSAYSYSGQKRTELSPLDLAMLAEQKGAGELIINSINQDGMMNGYDLQILEQICNKVKIPVIACGGAGELSHLRPAIETGAHAVAAGSMFVYHGPRRGILINYPEKTEILSYFSTTGKSGNE